MKTDTRPIMPKNTMLVFYHRRATAEEIACGCEDVITREFFAYRCTDKNNRVKTFIKDYDGKRYYLHKPDPKQRARPSLNSPTSR